MTASPFILLDDARDDTHPGGAAPARLYRDPLEVVVARRPEEVGAALDRLGSGEGEWAGYLAYEAGLALEPRLGAMAARRSGAAGPLVWFARFAGHTAIAAADVADWLAANGSGPARIGPMVPQVSLGGYARAFAGVTEAIHAGDIYQANLTFPLAGSYHGDPLALYAAVRADARAGYGGVVWDGSHWLLSFSPELFFKSDGQAVTVRPMKGTAPRGRTDAEDATNRTALADNAKDRAENLMIVDLMRNDLSRVAEPGSVRVEAPFAVETYPTLHTMVTTICARVRSGTDQQELLRAIFPCGSITGAPKIRAMELIDALERDARGAYCGAIGRIGGASKEQAGQNPAGEAAFNVAIRTLRLDPRAGRAVMGVGSAVVADSGMLAERRECVMKGRFLSLSVGQADLIETMHFDPHLGVALLELHLERMRASAAELEIAFDRHSLRNAIQALCFDIAEPAKLRLMVARSGAHTLEVAPLPAPLTEPAICAVIPLPVATGDWRLRHKTSDRAFYEDAHSAALKAGALEALFLRDDGLLTEGTFTSLFVARDGLLVTPPTGLGLLPGVLRQSLIDAGRAIEGEVRIEDLANGFHIGNALRGLIPARLLGA
ncbi:aminodeoxychorismate synthase component I [Novosphingobium sp.]|uniref:aminodeoxychorismate synthase component I n=1 Tax=Novosphingobium sp. TaxID=1874826 RepID=UPI0025D3AFD0|nr:aminodeoxychorismate synthase component I [Novosphingobium sp.]